MRLMSVVAIALAAVASVASVTMLLLSGWFIAASALASAAVGVIAFNYLIPSSLIRLLAFARILANYSANALGHDVLLRRLTSLRSRLFDRVMSVTSGDLQQKDMDLLERQIVSLANVQVAVLPQLWSVLVVCGLSAVVVMLWLPELWPWLLLGAVSVVLLLLMARRLFAEVMATRDVAVGDFRQQLSRLLQSASLWSLHDPEPPLRSAMTGESQSLRRMRQTEVSLEWFLYLVSLGLVLLLVWLMPVTLSGDPLLMLMPLLLLALPEWLGPVLRSQRSAAEYDLARRAIGALPDELQTSTASAAADRVPIEEDQCPLTLELRDFSWCRGHYSGAPLSACWKRGELVLVGGGSGSGKSSLLMAVAGLLPSDGELRVSGGRREGSEWRLAHLHYDAQEPEVLAGSLRSNLLVADPTASDERLRKALEFAALEGLAGSLDTWLGEQGRLLSGGEKKRLGLARAWLTSCCVWLLDEPFEGLDADLRRRLAASIREAASDRIVLLVSHRLVPELSIDQRLMLDGELVLRSAVA